MTDGRGNRAAIPEILVGLGLVALSAFTLWQSFEIPVAAIYAKVGPRIFPILVGVAIGLLACALLAVAWRGSWRTDEERSTPVDRRALAWVAAGLAANTIILGADTPRIQDLGIHLPGLGFTAASTAMFVLVARGFGSQRIARNALIGATFALAAYFGFARSLGINIGAGLIERALGG
ncbi:MAG: tripartite tricarboxylate transporter TctB family protein [Alphaproteobacteria bacterium]